MTVMNETLIVMAAVMVVGILPIIAIAALAIRALNKSLASIEAAVVERSTKFDEGIEEINRVLDQKDQHNQDTVDKISKPKGRR